MASIDEITREPSAKSSVVGSESEGEHEEAGALKMFARQLNDLGRITTAAFEDTGSFEPLQILDYTLFDDQYGILKTICYLLILFLSFFFLRKKRS